ncbi:MAG: hypothetical protein K6T80_00160 [Firmicutes bacterium]|nr:hypothetical protein [Bacillota bacterium]
MVPNKKLLVLCMVREADNALTYQTMLNRSNLRAEELLQTVEELVAEGKLRTFSGDEEKPLEDRRYLTVPELRNEIVDEIGAALPGLAAGGRMYFVYGAGLDPGNMYGKWYPESHFICRGCLDGYRLVFERRSGSGEEGVAAIRRSQHNSVWGAIYYLPPGTVDSPLDDQKGGVKIRVAAKSALGMVCVETTGSVATENLYPRRSYLDMLLRGGQLFNLPQQYLRLLAVIPTAD